MSSMPRRDVNARVRVRRHVSEADASKARVDIFMEAVLGAAKLLEHNSFTDDQRSRCAACAYGAMDLLCQAHETPMGDEEWLSVGTSTISRYFGDGSAEAVGVLAAEVLSGSLTYARSVFVGADAARSYLIEEDLSAISRCAKHIVEG